jgi:hypothetical protein
LPSEIPLPEEKPKKLLLPKSNPEEPIQNLQSIPEPQPPEKEKPMEIKRPVTQTLSYCYTETHASQNELYAKGIEETDDKFVNSYDQDYEMYEHMAMAYQSDVANQVSFIVVREVVY